MTMPAFAESEAVQKTAKGVMEVILSIHDNENDKDYAYFGGSGFLINDNTLVTCYHVVNINDETTSNIAKAFNMSVADVKDGLSYTVTIDRDVTIGASLISNAQSADMDFSILQLDQPVNGLLD